MSQYVVDCFFFLKLNSVACILLSLKSKVVVVSSQLFKTIVVSIKVIIDFLNALDILIA